MCVQLPWGYLWKVFFYIFMLVGTRRGCSLGYLVYVALYPLVLRRFCAVPACCGFPARQECGGAAAWPLPCPGSRGSPGLLGGWELLRSGPFR